MMKLARVETVLGLGLMLLAAACTKDPGNGGGASEAVSKTTVTFASSRYVNGAIRPFSISAGDAVTLVHVDSGEKSEAMPVSTGGESSVYLFGLRKPAKGDLLAAYHPTGAGVSFASGKASFDFPAAQDGTDRNYVRIGTTINTGSAYSGNSVTLVPMMSLVMGKMKKGPYSVTKAVFTAAGGEKVAGNMTLDLATNEVSGGRESSITVTLKEPLDCSSSVVSIPVIVPPVTLSKGFTITYTLSDGNTVNYSTTDRVTFTSGGTFDTDPASMSRQLIACGSNKVYIFDEEAASRTGDYKDGLLWSWDATSAASVVGLASNRMDHIDEAKPIDGGKKLLITSSYQWAVILDIATKQVEWFSNNVTNAHSADLLPGDLVAVAVSDGGDAVKLFSRKTSNQVLGTYPLESGHGVVWSDKMQRLYAIGSSSLQVYKLNGGSSPSLELEKTVSTKGYSTGLHDLVLVDENTLAMGGSKAALYNMNTGVFTPMAHFNNINGIKSINYDPFTGEAYYTYAAEGTSEGSYTWSTHTVRYTDNVQANDGGADKKTIKVNDINMYKVRVMNW